LGPGPFELEQVGAAAGLAGRLQQAGLAPPARHGGHVVLVGYYAVELSVRGAAVTAFVSDAFGKPYPAGHLGLMLAFGSEAKFISVNLAWDAASESYRARVDQQPGLAELPVRVSLTAGERTHLGGYVPSPGARAN
jgi:hypothetical protein